MMGKKKVVICSMLFVAMFGCSSVRKAQINSELQDLKSKKDSSQSRLNSIMQSISALQSQMQSNHSTTLGIIRDNPGKVACIASGAVGLSSSNAFSDDAKQLGTIVGLGCLTGYILNEDFQKETDSFVKELNNSSERETSLHFQIDQATRAWQDEKTLFDDLSARVDHLNQELLKLE